MCEWGCRIRAKDAGGKAPVSGSPQSKGAEAERELGTNFGVQSCAWFGCDEQNNREQERVRTCILHGTQHRTDSQIDIFNVRMNVSECHTEKTQR